MESRQEARLQIRQVRHSKARVLVQALVHNRELEPALVHNKVVAEREFHSQQAYRNLQACHSHEQLYGLHASHVGGPRSRHRRRNRNLVVLHNLVLQRRLVVVRVFHNRLDHRMQLCVRAIERTIRPRIRGPRTLRSPCQSLPLR